MSYIEIKDVKKQFGSFEALKGVSMEIEQGTLVTLLGPSGCGKSTLLRCLSGLETVTSGTIILDGRDVTNVSARERGIGMVFQQYSLFPTMTIEKNVAFGLQVQHVNANEIKERVKEMLSIVGLSDFAHRYPAQLSGGQQQRAALARALVTNPKVLLLDEPLSAIDAQLRKNLQHEIRRIQKERAITTIFVTHDQEEAMVMSDRIHLFNVGQIEQSGTPVEMYTMPATRFAASFIGNYNILDAVHFKELIGIPADCEKVAIRPESFRITDYGFRFSGNCACFSGTVKDSVSHGNIIRYTIATTKFSVVIEQLFAGKILNIGEEINFEVPYTEILALRA